MVYAAVRNQPSIRTRPTSNVFFAPELINSARKIYRTYCNLNTQNRRKPVGVAIDRESHKGQLIFRGNAILLPGECFIDIDLIEAEVY